MELLINEKNDVWQRMAECGKPIVLYGMGNGADKILAVMEQYGLEAAGFFASDGFVRGHTFHGKRVMSYSEARQTFDDMLVVIAFASSLPDVIARFREIDSAYETVAPDVPVAGDTLFCAPYFKEHRTEFDAVYRMLADEESRRIYKNILSYKLSGKLCYLFEAESDYKTVNQTLVRPDGIRRYMDLGAYNGDTVRALLNEAPALQTVYAMEPDARTYKKLTAYAQNETRAAVHTYPYAAWNKREELVFHIQGSRSSALSQNGTSNIKTRTVTAERPDAVLNGLPVDYIKYDVEGAERQALEGSAETIRSCMPKLLVSLYHRTEDLFALPLYIRALQPGYRFYLRRFPYVPAWDIDLYCIPESDT